jgi:DNA-binding XRE family transcriptional regulator
LKKRGNIFKISGKDLEKAYAKHIKKMFSGTSVYCLRHSRISDHFFAEIKSPKIIADEDGHIAAEFSAKTYAKSNPKDLRINKAKIKEQKIELLDLLENRYFEEFSVDGVRQPKLESGTGQKLKALRLNKNLTLKSRSELTGIANSTLCDYEAGRKNYGRKVAPKLADALGVSVEELIDSSEHDVFVR